MQSKYAFSKAVATAGIMLAGLLLFMFLATSQWSIGVYVTCIIFLFPYTLFGSIFTEGYWKALVVFAGLTLMFVFFLKIVTFSDKPYIPAAVKIAANPTSAGCHSNIPPGESSIGKNTITFTGTPIDLPDMPPGSKLTLKHVSGIVVINESEDVACQQFPVYGVPWTTAITNSTYGKRFGEVKTFTHPVTNKVQKINVCALYLKITGENIENYNVPFLENYGGLLTFENNSTAKVKPTLLIHDSQQNSSDYDDHRRGNMKISYKIQKEVE